MGSKSSGDRVTRSPDMEVATFLHTFSNYNLPQLLISIFIYLFIADHINLLWGRAVNAVLSHENFISQESAELESEGGERGARLRSLCWIINKHCIYIYKYP